MTATTYLDYQDRDPYAYFEDLRRTGPVVWDDGIGAWLVTGFTESNTVVRKEDIFGPPWPHMGFAQIFGRRGLFLLAGDEHRKLYTAVKTFFTPQRVESYRTTYVRPVIEQHLGRLGRLRRVDLAASYAQQIPVRVIAGILGLDWRDEELAENCWAWTDAFQRHTGRFFLPGPKAAETHDAAVESVKRLDELLVPLVREQRGSHADTYISNLWRVGPEIFPDWSEEDMVDQSRFLFIAGMHTTTELISNSAHLVLHTPGMKAALLADESLAGPFVEEALRLYPSLQIRVRIAEQDTVLGNASITKGDRVCALLAAANRDPARFAAPAEVDLERPNPTAHLSFNAGPRFCGGAPLARTEAAEALSALLRTFPGLELDEDAQPPQFMGFLQRGYHPLNVLLSSSEG